MNPSPDIKEIGAYYTPDRIVKHLVSWATADGRHTSVIDPSCGDGRFLEELDGAVGIDIDPVAIAEAAESCPSATILAANFFDWAGSTSRRFKAAVGNPPFIRYQRFVGDSRTKALQHCERHGVHLSGLTSSWAPFVITAASILEPGGRLAFIVPAEISYAVYARPVLEYLLNKFSHVVLVAFQEKIFPNISEDCWMLFADGFGGKARHLKLCTAESFVEANEKYSSQEISREDLQREGYRLRVFLLPYQVRCEYERLKRAPGIRRLGEMAHLGIGYVTGANDFFHLRPSEAERLRIPSALLRPAVRTNRDLASQDIDRKTIAAWRAMDKPFLLLDLSSIEDVPASVRNYLDTPEGQIARRRYKCQNRNPWFRVPDVRAPNAFLSIMTSNGPRLVGNSAMCVCTNSVHAVTLRNGISLNDLLQAWGQPLTRLSAEVEGHNLGGGMLKIEPVEARNILMVVDKNLARASEDILLLGIEDMHKWRRHNGI